MRNWDYKEKREELMEAAMVAFDILVSALREDIDLEALGSDKVKTAIQSKRVAFVDAFDMLSKINELDRSLKGTGDDGMPEVNTDGFNETLAERFIRQKK